MDGRGVRIAARARLDGQRFTRRRGETARARLAGAGIRACYFLQFGYPGEQWDDIQQTIDLVRSTRPDDIGVSFSYPLPGTAFFERVQEQIGSKRNWTDSDDLCLMFKAAYKDEFYLALRNALHAEVDSWHNGSKVDCALLWENVFALEQSSRNSEATIFEAYEPGKDQLVHLQVDTIGRLTWLSSSRPRLLSLRGPERASNPEALCPPGHFVSLLASAQAGFRCRRVRHHLLQPGCVVSSPTQREAFGVGHLRELDDPQERCRHPQGGTGAGWKTIVGGPEPGVEP